MQPLIFSFVNIIFGGKTIKSLQNSNNMNKNGFLVLEKMDKTSLREMLRMSFVYQTTINNFSLRLISNIKKKNINNKKNMLKKEFFL